MSCADCEERYKGESKKEGGVSVKAEVDRYRRKEYKKHKPGDSYTIFNYLSSISSKEEAELAQSNQREIKIAMWARGSCMPDGAFELCESIAMVEESA